MKDIIFKIGDIVVYGSGIPTKKYIPDKDVEGEIIAMIWGDMPKVRWNDGEVETYCQSELKLIERKRG